MVQTLHSKESTQLHCSLLTGICGSRDIIPGIPTRLPAGRSRIRMPVGRGHFLVSKLPKMGTAVVPRKESGRSVTLTPHTSISADVKNEWSYASTHPAGFHGAERDNFIFTFTNNYIVQKLPVTKCKVFIMVTKTTTGAICIVTEG
jgi:hypothetical protein